MEENKKPHTDKEEVNAQKQDKAPKQPDAPIGNITSKDDTTRLPDNEKETPPEEQTRGNP